MKKLALAALVALFAGCSTDKITVIEQPESTNSVMRASGFSGETYIWESWLYSTNRVEK